jgi:hypothetical protein
MPNELISFRLTQAEMYMLQSFKQNEESNSLTVKRLLLSVIKPSSNVQQLTFDPNILKQEIKTELQIELTEEINKVIAANFQDAKAELIKVSKENTVKHCFLVRLSPLGYNDSEEVFKDLKDATEYAEGWVQLFYTDKEYADKFSKIDSVIIIDTVTDNVISNFKIERSTAEIEDIPEIVIVEKGLKILDPRDLKLKPDQLKQYSRISESFSNLLISLICFIDKPNPVWQIHTPMGQIGTLSLLSTGWSATINSNLVDKNPYVNAEKEKLQKVLTKLGIVTEYIN